MPTGRCPNLHTSHESLEVQASSTSMTGVSVYSVHHGLEAARNGSVNHHYETIAVAKERILLVAIEKSLCLPNPPPVADSVPS